MNFSVKIKILNYYKTTIKFLKLNLNLDTGDSIDLKFGTSSQTDQRKSLFSLPCVMNLIGIKFNFNENKQ